MRRTQQIDDDVARVEVTGARGSDDAAQTVLRLGAALRAIAARDLTIHDDWAQRLAKQALKAYADEHSGRGVVVRDYGRESATACRTDFRQGSGPDRVADSSGVAGEPATMVSAPTGSMTG